jgi:hypothetical protein
MQRINHGPMGNQTKEPPGECHCNEELPAGDKHCQVKIEEREIAKKAGASPGAVVSLKIDYQTHLHVQGLVGIVYREN